MDQELKIILKAVNASKKEMKAARDDLKKLTTEAGKTQKGIKGLDDQQSKLKNSTQKLGDTLKRFVGFAVLATGIKKAFDVAGQFEQRMSDISTLISGDSTKSIAALKDGIVELSKSLPKSADELGASAYAIFSAGVTDAGEALKVLEASAKLAIAGLGTTEQATNLMTSAINSFKNEGLSASKIADILFTTVKNGKTTVAELSQGFGAVAGQVAATGIKFDEFMASVSALTTVGVPAAQAYTQLRAVIAGLTRETAESKEVFDELNVKTFKELIATTGGLTPALGEIARVLGDDDAKALKLVGSTEALAAIISLTTVVGDSYTATLKDMRDETENLSEAVDKQKVTFKAQSDLLRNQLNAALIDLGGEILPAVSKEMSFLTGQAGMLEDAIDRPIFKPNSDLISFFNVIADGISYTAQVIDDLSTKFKVAQVFFSKSPFERVFGKDNGEDKKKVAEIVDAFEKRTGDRKAERVKRDLPRIDFAAAEAKIAEGEELLALRQKTLDDIAKLQKEFRFKEMSDGKREFREKQIEEEKDKVNSIKNLEELKKVSEDFKTRFGIDSDENIKSQKETATAAEEMVKTISTGYSNLETRVGDSVDDIVAKNKKLMEELQKFRALTAGEGPDTRTDFEVAAQANIPDPAAGGILTPPNADFNPQYPGRALSRIQDNVRERGGGSTLTVNFNNPVIDTPAREATLIERLKIGLGRDFAKSNLASG